jgi:hypothetical protein
MVDREEARLLLHGSYEVVVELSIIGVEEKLAIRRDFDGNNSTL